jgi:outer membrane immunogenic protein
MYAKTTTALAVAVGLCAIHPAAAADMATKAPIMRAPLVAAYNWTGCYIGGNAGGVWGTSNIDIPAYPANFDIRNSSFTGGAQVGCNYQMQQIVIGIEGNWNWMDITGDSLTTGAAAERFSVHWNWDASLRGRLGWAVGGTPWLLYVTGGVAWANLESANFIPGAAVTTAQSGTHTGWTIGGGAEYQFTPNWIFGVEYRHSEYESKRYVYLGPVDVDLKTDAVTARLSYLFH